MATIQPQRRSLAEIKAKFDFVTSGVLPQCIMETEASILLRKGEK